MHIYRESVCVEASTWYSYIFMYRLCLKKFILSVFLIYQVEADYVGLHAARAVQLFVSMGSCMHMLYVSIPKYITLLIY